MTVVLIEYRVQPGKVAAAGVAVKALIAEVIAREKACLGITMHHEDGDDSRILLYEHWLDKETFLGPHMQTPHLKSFASKAKEFLMRAPEISYWQVVHSDGK